MHRYDNAKAEPIQINWIRWHALLNNIHLLLMNQLFTSTNSDTSNSICSILATIVHALDICYCMQCAYNGHDNAFLSTLLIPSMNLRVYTHEQSHPQQKPRFRAMGWSCTLYTSRHTVCMHDEIILPCLLIPPMHLRVYTHEQSQRRRNPHIRAVAAQAHRVQHAYARY